VTAHYRLTAFSVGGAEVKRVVLDRGWLGAFYIEGFEMRTADIGAPVLPTAAALTLLPYPFTDPAASPSTIHRWMNM
jgi:hypothetical protein